jgi:hypothetical protein
MWTFLIEETLIIYRQIDNARPCTTYNNVSFHLFQFCLFEYDSQRQRGKKNHFRVQSDVVKLSEMWLYCKKSNGWILFSLLVKDFIYIRWFIINTVWLISRTYIKTMRMFFCWCHLRASSEKRKLNRINVFLEFVCVLINLWWILYQSGYLSGHKVHRSLINYL